MDLSCLNQKNGRGLSAATLLAALLLCGCASYDISPVPASKTDVNDANWGTDSGNHSEGYLIFQPELYFKAVITPAVKDASGKETSPQTVTLSSFYLPNYKKPYRVTTCNFLAKADFTFAFADGWQLTSISDKSDNSTVANTLANQLSAVLSTAKVFGLDAGTSKTVVTAFYHPTYDKNGIIDGFTQVNLPSPK